MAAATAAHVARHRRALLVSIFLGFFVGGFSLASIAWHRAWRPPLRLVFEDLARAQRHRAEAEGRRMPEDDEAFAIVEGILRADAAPGESGIAVAVDVDRVIDRTEDSEDLSTWRRAL